MRRRTNIIEAVLFSCPVLGKQEVCRLAPGQATLVWHPHLRDSGSLLEVTVNRKIIETHHYSEEDGAGWLSPVEGTEMVRASADLHAVGTLESPNISISTRIGDSEPSFWVAPRHTKSKREAATWKAVTGREIGHIFRGGQVDTDPSGRSVITPHLGVVTAKPLDDRSHLVWMVTGGGATYWTPMLPAAAMPFVGANGAFTNLPEDRVEVYRKGLSLLLAMGLPIAVGWANTCADRQDLVSYQITTPQRPLLASENESKIAAEVVAQTARRVAQDLDMPELAQLAVHGEAGCSDGFRVFLGTVDGRAAADTVMEETMKAAGAAVRAIANPVWGFNSAVASSANPYAEIGVENMNQLREGFNRVSGCMAHA